MKQLNKNKSRLLAMLMTFMMIFSMIPQAAFASINYGEYPFTEITTDAGDAISITDEGTVDYNYYSNVPYYHVTIPEGATEVYVTHSSSEDPFADMSYGSAYGYYAETAGWTGGYMTYNFEATADGYKIVLPLSESVTDLMTGETTDMSFVADEDGNVEYAVAVERNDYSPICFFTFEYASSQPGESGTPEEGGDDANEETSEQPFQSIKIDGAEVAAEKIVYKGIFELGDYAADEQQDVTDGYDYVHKVPYYHVTVPCGTEYVDVTYPEEADIMNYPPDAYGYKTDLEVDAITSATVRGTTFTNAYTKNEDGTQTVKTPVIGYTFDSDGKGHAITLEGNGEGFPALCLFSFIYDGVNHVYEEGVCSCGAIEPVAIPEGTNIERITEVTSFEKGEPISFSMWDMEYSDIPSYIATIPEGTEAVELTFKTGTHPEPYSNKISGSMLRYNEEDGGYSASGTESSASQGEDGLYTITLNAGDMIRNGNFYGAYDTSYNTQYVLGFKYPEGAHEHTYDNVIVTINPTCTEPGLKTFTCTGCEEGTEGHSYTEEVAALGHTYNNGEITTPATCVATGVKTFTCTVCEEGTKDHTKTETVAKLGHTYDEGVVTTEPTCMNAGVKTYTCVRDICTDETTGHTKTESIEATGKHTYENGSCTGCGAPVQDENGVYQIGTKEAMEWFAAAVNGGQTAIKGVLTADITVDADWPGIGTSSNRFKGTFDGQNHTVSNLSRSLFGYVKGASNTDRAEIKNVTVDGEISGGTEIGGIANNAENVLFEKCVNSINITGTTNLGGIVGNKANINANVNVTISNCLNEGDITATGAICGGITSCTKGGLIVTGCANTGNITGKASTNTTDGVGGIAGYMQGYKGTALVENCYNLGKVTNSSDKLELVGGLVGNAYNGTQITNCYNAGESTYALAGNCYNSTVKIINTYYRGDLCKATVPDLAKVSCTNVASKTATEMSSDDFAKLLGEAFKQSCPTAVLTWQEASDHTLTEDGSCEDCGFGADIKVEYSVTFNAADGAEIVGDETFVAGDDYTFNVNIKDGYYKGKDFSVSVNNEKLEAVEGVYTVKQPNGPFTIDVTDVKKYKDELAITLPGEGDGYRVTPCDGYSEKVNSKNDFKFKVTFVDGFEAGEDFAVKTKNSEAEEVTLTPDENGIYTIETVMFDQTVTVNDVKAIPGQTSVKIRIDCTTGDKKFLVPETTDEIMMDKEVEIPYFDIELYELGKYYYNPYCYLDKDGNVKARQEAGTPETAYNVVTAMHAFIYMTEVYYLGYDAEDAGKGYSDLEDTDKDGVSDFDEAVSWTQGVGSTFMDLWGLGTNLNYHLNYRYPIAYPEFGSTSDQQALKDGDLLSVHMIEGSANGSAFGLFVVNDDNGEYDDSDQKDTVTVTQGESVSLTHYSADQGEKYSTSFVTVPDTKLYWTTDSDVESNVTMWNSTDFGTNVAENFKTDGNGEIIIETEGLEPGIYYIGAAGGFRKGSGVPDSAGFVSNGAEGGPAYFKLTVAAVEQPDQPTEPEDPTEPSEPDQGKDTVIRQEKLDADSLEKKEELKAAGYDTVEKIENKLFKEMTVQVDYVVTKDNTTILDIELVYDGTDQPVSAEDFPEEGLDIYIAYDKIFGDKTVDYSKYDYKVVHMFSADTETHKAGDIEVLVPEVTEEGLKVHVKGLSPFAISYVEKDDNSGGENQPTEPSEPDQPTQPEDPTEPSEPDQPTQPEDPTEPSEPVEPDQPTELDQPTDEVEDSNVQQNDDEQNADKDDSVKTGDESNIFIYFLAMLMAIIVAVGVRRKEN